MIENPMSTQHGMAAAAATASRRTRIPVLVVLQFFFFRNVAAMEMRAAPENDANPASFLEEEEHQLDQASPELIEQVDGTAGAAGDAIGPSAMLATAKIPATERQVGGAMKANLHRVGKDNAELLRFFVSNMFFVNRVLYEKHPGRGRAGGFLM